MRKRIKHVVSLVLLAGILAVVPGQEGKAAQISAAGGDGAVSVYSLYSRDVQTMLNIEGRSAMMTGRVSGIAGTTTKIHMKLVLQMYLGGNWSDVKTYETTATTTNCTLMKNREVICGKYRLKGVYTIYKGSKSEKITQYSETVSC